MKTCLKFAVCFCLLLPLLSFSKSVSRKPSNASALNGIKAIEASVQKVESDVLKAPEVTQNQKYIFAAMSYSLFSPTFDSETLKKQNQESLGLSALIGYSYLPYSGWGFQTSLGIMQHSKTDRSLPDFVLFKPGASISLSVYRSLYITGGLFNYVQQGEQLKNFQSYIGQEFFIGYKANKKINIRFGYSFTQFSADFASKESMVQSLVSIRGIESQLLYLF